MPDRRTVFFVSDRTGITAEMLGNSLLSQFEDFNFQRVTIPFVDTPDKIDGRSCNGSTRSPSAKAGGLWSSARSSTRP